MNRLNTLDTKRHTYYYGCLTKYELSEAEKENRRYMILQKSAGVVILIIAALSLLIVKIYPDFGLFTIIMGFMGIILLLTDFKSF
jgi:hypothetical protein